MPGDLKERDQEERVAEKEAKEAREAKAKAWRRWNLQLLEP